MFHKFLVTGDDQHLTAFHVCVDLRLNCIERRADTCLYTCLDTDYDLAELVAKEVGVTLEEIVFDDGKEAYRMIHLSEFGTWADVKERNSVS